MKKKISAIILFLLIGKIAKSQDTLYIYDNGSIVYKRSVLQIDSMVFNKSTNSTVMDINGNIYNTKQFGNQIWMTENLKVTRYNNGDSILTTNPPTLNTTGFDLTNNETKYVWNYNGDENLVSSNGRLYTWYAVIDNRNVCPSGWHLPSNSEWNELKTNLLDNGYGYEGSGPDIGKALSSTSNWYPSDNLGTIGKDISLNNSSGFNAQPAGGRVYQSFDYMGYSSYWWSADSHSLLDAYKNALNWNGYELVESFSPKITGYSVRCLKNK